MRTQWQRQAVPTQFYSDSSWGAWSTWQLLDSFLSSIESCFCLDKDRKCALRSSTGGLQRFHTAHPPTVPTHSMLISFEKEAVLDTKLSVVLYIVLGRVFSWVCYSYRSLLAFISFFLSLILEASCMISQLTAVFSVRTYWSSSFHTRIELLQVIRLSS